MSALKELLDREAHRIGADPAALDAIYRLRDVRRRQRQITTAVVAIGLSLAVMLFFIGSVGRHRAVPADQSTLRHSGAIAVRATTGDRRGAIVEVDPVTGAETELPVPLSAHDLVWPGKHPSDLSWSPDGSELAYSFGPNVWVLHVATGESREIFTDCGPWSLCELAWAPDGTTIAVAHQGVLETIAPDGTHGTTLSLDVDAALPTWSPDATRLAFTSGNEVVTSLYIVRRDGSDLTMIQQENSPSPFGIWMPTWSPDGTRIAYLSSDDSSGNPAPVFVRVIHSDGSDARTILQAGRCLCLGFTPGISWSPDGTQIAAVVPKPSSHTEFGLYVMNADGSGLRLVREGAWGRPAWQPLP